jgi:hypothetical protein
MRLVGKSLVVICLAASLTALTSAGRANAASCQGNRACDGNTGTIEDESCVGGSACLNNQGDISTDSCRGFESCSDNKANVGLMQ